MIWIIRTAELCPLLSTFLVFCFLLFELGCYWICTYMLFRGSQQCFYLRFNGHFPDGPGLAGIRMFQFWILLELSMMEMVVTTWRYKTCKAPVITINKWTPSFLRTGCPSCHPTNSVRAPKLYYEWRKWKWVPAVVGKEKAGMAHSDCGWTCGCVGKTVKSLENTCYTWALLRWWFTMKRRYIKCTYLYLY